DELRRHRSVIGRLIARLERDWGTLASKGLTRQLAEIELPGHRRDVASDLDLLGKASLFHLVSMVGTTAGIRTLAHWLSGPAVAAVAQERASAIETLAPMREERLRFYTLSRQVGESTGDPDRFVQWATGRPWLESRRPLVVWSQISALLAAVLIGMVVLAGFRLLPAFWFRSGLIGLFLLTVVNLLLTAAVLGPAHAIFSIAMANRRAVDDYQEIFAAAAWLPRNAGGSLAEIRQVLLDGPKSATAAMRAMRKVAAAGALRQSAGTFLLYLPLQCFALWDVRVLRRLEKWQADYRDEVTAWFDALGQLESLLSLAALRDEYPGWAQPVWHDDSAPPVLRADSIGHPLLTDQVRVCNDVQVGPPGTLLLVTGSNMSGKSTMLRSLGLNVALAGAGAPVCARRFHLPSVELATSIRVSDDLSEGVSFYMAELQRLKSVVDQARQMSRTEDRVCLFLLDE
ncbi:MAG: DNA mismatch repair protein, partial [Pirellulales bacterium]|nr:DNA mismatch repair protein [Pirellulales bacterium]